MKRLLRLYPPAWRARYGAELAEVLDELPPSRGAALDLARGALVEWLHASRRAAALRVQPAGGPPMLEHRLQRYPTTLAVVALLLVTPTLVFIVLSLLAHELGLAGLAAWWDPVVVAITSWRLVDLFLVAAPLLSFVIALVPLIGVGAARGDRELRLTVALRARALNVTVLGLCLALGGLLTWHLLVELALEAR